MAMQATAAAALDEEESDPAEILAWAFRRFAGRKLVLTTSFGMEGCALIDMVARHPVEIPVIYLDTMFLFPETYALRDRMVARYPRLRFENRGTTLTAEAQAQHFGPELWRRDPNRCCAIRKVEPMRRALAGADVWITGLMRSQGSDRSTLRAVEWDGAYELIKVSPLAGWDRRRVWDYVRAHDVPYNELHERGYPTVGCTHCTRRCRARPRATTRAAAAGPAPTRPSAGCTSPPAILARKA